MDTYAYWLIHVLMGRSIFQVRDQVFKKNAKSLKTKKLHNFYLNLPCNFLCTRRVVTKIV